MGSKGDDALDRVTKFLAKREGIDKVRSSRVLVSDRADLEA